MNKIAHFSVFNKHKSDLAKVEITQSVFKKTGLTPLPPITLLAICFIQGFHNCN